MDKTNQIILIEKPQDQYQIQFQIEVKFHYKMM